MDIFSLIIVSWALFGAYFAFSAIGVKKDVVKKRTDFYLLIIIIIFLLLFQSQNWRQIMLRETTNIYIIKIAGLLFFALGLGFAVLARIYLGSNWGVPMSLKENHKLITSGPYSLVRHPIYFGILLSVLGSALANGIIWVIIFIVFSAYFFYSAIIEEKNMTQKFPKEYPEYKKKTKMLIPFVL